ncbi:MAG: hypothetical protein PHG64_12370, partial [Paludibacter sp.]|nr:hypothetical protein [Paludibacter sp.]
MMDYKEQITNRIIIILEKVFSRNKTLFGKTIGYDESRIRSYTHQELSDRSMPPAEVIAAIVDKVEINPDWLLLGKGEMLKSDDIANKSPEWLLDRLEDYCRENERLRS